MRRFMVYDRADGFLFELDEDTVFEIVRAEEINGEHSLTVTTARALSHGWRILVQDDRGKWREYVVYGTDEAHAEGNRVFGTYFCVWSMQHDLMGAQVSAMPGTQTPCTAAVALAAALETTARWSAGTVTVQGTAGASMYDMSAWQALSVLVGTWGGEIDASITVDTQGVVSRAVDLYAQQGSGTAYRRFDFGADMASVSRKIADGPLYCRISPRGMGEQVGEGYGRKITIASVNDGKDYLENTDMTDLAKLPDGQGGWEYPTIIAENPQCQTPADLKAWGLSVLDEYTVPKVTYTVDVIQASAEGADMFGVALGDAVQVVDRKFGDGLRLAARVRRVEVDELMGGNIKVVLGNIANGISGVIDGIMGAMRGEVDSLLSTVKTMNGGTMSTADYLDRLLTRMNADINATGGYAYIVKGHGILCYDKAVTDPTVGAEADQVVEIKGGTIRIANSKTAQGAWEWKTVFVSGHIAAAVVTAANLVAGYIGNVNGNYWNLDTGELIMKSASGVVLDDTDLETLLQNVDSTITGVDIQYAQNASSTTAPTSGWSTTAPAWQEGYYIWQRTATTTPSGTYYSTPVMISGRDGSDGTSVTILGSYNSLADLQTAHPTGNTGDGYIVGDDLYVWNGSSWEDVGAIRGPQGPAGTDGADGSQIWTATADPTTPDYTFALSALTGPSNVSPKVGDLIVRSYYRYTISSVGSTSVLAGSRTSIRGSSGSTGTGVSQIVEQYYLSTSNTTRTGGSWSTNQPAWVDGKYIWTRSKITWTNNTITFTDPVLAQAINGANENASTAITEAAKANAVVRSYNSGVLVCRNTNTIGSLVNADGSFDVVKVTWSDGIPTAGDTLARFSESQIWLGKNSSNSIIDLCNGAAQMKLTTNVDHWTNEFTIQSNDSVAMRWLADGTSHQTNEQQAYVWCSYSTSTDGGNSRVTPRIDVYVTDDEISGNWYHNAGFYIKGAEYYNGSLSSPAQVYSISQFVELYFNSSGSSGNITLNYDINTVGSKYIVIHYKGNDGYMNSTTIHSLTTGDNFADLHVVESTVNGSLNIKSRRIKINGKNLTNVSYAEMDNGTTPTSTNHIYIVSVMVYSDFSNGD